MVNTITLNHALTINEDKSPVTVVLVVSEDDFERKNINNLIKSFNAVINIFPDFNYIRYSLCLVINVNN